MFINSEHICFDDKFAQIFLKCEMPALERLKILHCTMNDKYPELISKTEYENLK